MQEYLSTLVENMAASIPNIVTALLIFLVSLYIARWLSNGVKRVLLNRDTDSGVTHLLADILRWTIVIFGTITALQRFFNVTAFLTGLGILGFTVGFALQNVTQNFVSGIILLIQQPFKVGDEISVINFEGVVLQINLRTTEMQTLDGRIVILPNAEVLAHPIVNYTRAHRRRVDLPMAVSHGKNPEKIRAALFEAMKAVPGYAAAPAPVVAFTNFGTDSSIELLASFWVDTSATTVPLAKDAALLKVKETFAAGKFPIPARLQKKRTNTTIG
ncbi:MAG: mechanosensitive ion channel [Anaerolineales bacterium]|nr:mechanosensitive ion channel [Anaerolineales bacterium]